MGRQLLLMCWLLSLLTLAVYWQVGNYEFVNFDDPLRVTENDHFTAALKVKPDFAPTRGNLNLALQKVGETLDSNVLFQYARG